MSTQQKKVVDSEKSRVKQIVKYLREHPDFFECHQDLLADMVLLHESGDAVSLIERQVSVLRDQKNTLKQKLNTLLNAARQNEQLIERLNMFVLELLDASTLEDVLSVIQDRLIRDFQAHAVLLRLFNASNKAMSQLPEFADWSEPVMEAFEKVITTRKPVCGNLKQGQLDSLFGEHADQINSAALIPLIENDNSKSCYGMLAIGSHDKNRFQATMGTMFLSNLGKVIARILKPHLSNKSP